MRTHIIRFFILLGLIFPALVHAASAPGAPTGIAATAGNAQAAVSFTPPASNGGAAIIFYTVTSSPGGMTGSGSSSPITVTGLTNGTAYTFTVTATNPLGTSLASAASNAVTPVPPGIVPDAPTNASAAIINAQATVSFTASANNGGAAIVYYTVTASPGGQTGYGLASPVTVTGLNGTAYTFTITATNSAGTSLGASASATENYTDNSDGTVTDFRTGLTWMRCAMGQTWSGTTCTGTAGTYNWDQAMALTSTFAGKSDWRLPNERELQTIVDRSRYGPAIDIAAFPNTLSGYFWSGSPFASGSSYAWYVNFNGGYADYGYKSSRFSSASCAEDSLWLFCLMPVRIPITPTMAMGR